MTRFSYHLQHYINFLRPLCLFLALIIAPLALAGASHAQNSQQIEQHDAKGTRVAMVIVDGIPLFRVAGTTTVPARERAASIAYKIRMLAKDKAFNPNTLVLRKVDDTLVKIYVKEQHFVDIFKEDAQLEGSFSPMVLAEELVLPKIINAIKNYRSERDSKVLLEKAVRAFGWTFFLSVLLFVLLWFFKRVEKIIGKRFSREIDKLEVKSLQLLKSQHIWLVIQTISHVIRAVLILGVVYFFIDSVLSLFPWTRYVAQTFLGYVVAPLLSMSWAIIDYLPDLFFLVIFFLVIRFLLRIAYALFNGIDRGQIKFSGFDAEWAWPTFQIIRTLVIIFAVVVAYPYLPGSGSEAFKGVSLLLGVLFSIGSSSLIANIIAGYTMTYRRAFKVGDRVKIGANIGEVLRIRSMVTHLRSHKNEEVVIPNSTILNGEITNYSAMADKYGLILHTSVGIGYEVPWRQVEAMLLMAAERTEGLQPRTEPFVLQTALGDFSITYELNVYTRKVDQIPKIYAELHRNIQDVFNEYEVAIMTPHYIEDTKSAKIVKKEHWYTSPARLPKSETPETKSD